jgi:hypothetical protein
MASNGINSANLELLIDKKVINIPVCEIKGSSLMNFLIFYKLLKKLKTRLKETIHKAFSHRNYGSKFVVLGYKSTYFSNKIQKGKTCYSEEQVISMLELKRYLWSLTSSSGGYSNGINSANLELLIDKKSSIYLYVKLKALAS